jgi:hypothetical protein
MPATFRFTQSQAPDRKVSNEFTVPPAAATIEKSTAMAMTSRGGAFQN